MKLKAFNLTTMPKPVGGWGGITQPRIAFSKSGTVNFNTAACELLELRAGNKIALSQDEEEPDNWYLFADPVNGFPVRSGYDKKGCMFNHRLLINEVIKYFELKEDATHNFLIAGQATTIKGDKTKYWGLIKPVKI